MERIFYTINQVAEILEVHHKTVRGFITEGKLKASKVGKQWRISKQDLYSFMGKDNTITSKEEGIEFSNSNLVKKENNRIQVSSVLDLLDIDKDQYMRLSNTLIAVMNSRDFNMQESSVNMKYYEEQKQLKILLWGDIACTKELFDIILLLIGSDETHGTNKK